jgi:glycosyltransferase involved in cell wall biosynthesis
MELVDIAEELQRRGAGDVLLVMIGDGAERPMVEQAVRDRGLDNVLFLGQRSKTEVADWHAAAGLVLTGIKPFPVLATASPNKVFDALAAGRVVLYNTEGWLRDILVERDSGQSYPTGEVGRAVDMILALRDDPAERLRIESRARALAVEMFSRDDLAAKFAELFEE